MNMEVQSALSPSCSVRKILPLFMQSALLGLLAMGLVACNNSSNSSNDSSSSDSSSSDSSNETVEPPGAPTLSMTPTPIKNFSFSWNEVAGDVDEFRLLENPDGESGFAEVASIDADATEHNLEVLLPARLNARYILQACNSGGCSDSSSLSVSGDLTEAVGYFKGSNTEADDYLGYFGIALSADGTTLAIGSARESSDARGINGDQDNNDSDKSGAVYVFIKEDGAWEQEAYIKASNTGADARFGSSVALSGDGGTLVVGSEQESNGATGVSHESVQDNSGANESGAVYVFTRDSGTWAQEAYIKASNTNDGDRFGSSVALSSDGDTLVVGASYENNEAADISHDAVQDNSGADDSGAAYVFTRNSGTWAQEAYIKPSNSGEDDRFGTSVALSSDGDVLVVGAPRESNDATGISHDAVLSNSGASRSGAVYVFTRDSGSWVQDAYVKASNTDNGDRFGTSVALSLDGDTLVAGARRESNDATGISHEAVQDNSGASRSGAAYVFNRDSGTWAQEAYIKANNSDEDFEFGASAALSADGGTLAIGASGDNSNATGIGGDQNNSDAKWSGAVFLY